MSIETDIKQVTPFKSPYHRVLVNLIYTSNWVINNQMRLIRTYKVSLQQYNVLRILRGQYPNPIRVANITERMLDKMSNASRLVDKLVLKQLVERTECPNDRRAVDVVITEKGLALLTKLDSLMGEWADEQRQKMNEEDAAQLSYLLDQMRT